jgi:hypothetical protein
MAEPLSADARGTILQAARTMFPHDGLPDEAYEKVVVALERDAAGDPEIRPKLTQGVAELDADGPFAARDEDARLERLRALEGGEFFGLLHATAVVELYDNPLVWRAFGYEGPSVHRGGYVQRGFDDLDWLPDPQITFDRDAPSAATPETTHQFNRA